MITNNSKLSRKEELRYIGIGISIGIFYVGLFMLVTGINWNEVEIIPEADGQILPFEQQLEQIRDPKECTRKVVQGASAELPFTLKIVYDTSKNVKLEFKQQGTSFPVVQRTNQVMTFFSDGADQYEIYIEVNYEEAKPRQMYIEYLANGAIVQSEQEKFETKRFCMTIFANTVKPVPLPTKEEIFGESLDYIKQIPAMVTAFNANSQTSATSISYMWILLFAVLILAILTLIGSETGKRRFNSRMDDFEDSIGEVNKMTVAVGELKTGLTKPLHEIIKNLRAILNLPEIKEKLPAKKKELFIKKFFRKKVIKQTKDTMKELNNIEAKPKVNEESDSLEKEVLKELQPTAQEIKEEQKQQKPSGGFVLEESVEEQEPEITTEEQKTPPTQKDEDNPMKLQPKVFLEILKEIDFENEQLKEGGFEKFTYTELNESFAWISDYRKWIEKKKIVVPTAMETKQRISEEVIYNAIFKKIKMRNDM